jgi:hypothetical protein
MKNIKPAMDDLQIACMSGQITFKWLANVRKALISSIRESLVEAGATQEYLAKFDKTLVSD